MNRTYTIAIYAADTLAGETLVRQLEEHNSGGQPLPVLTIYPIVDSAEASGYVEFHGEPVEFVAVDHMDFSATDILVLPAGCQRHPDLMVRAVECGCVIIDASRGAATLGHTQPVMVAFNEHFLAEAVENRYLAVPATAIASLLPMLHRVHQQYGLSRINLVVMEPVAALGKQGIDALRQQTIELLNGKPVENKQFAHRLAYNVIPEQASLAAGNETLMQRELRLALGESTDVRVTCVTTPVFYGDSYTVDLDTVQPFDLEDIKLLIAEQRHFSVADDSSLPTIENAAGSDDIYVGNFRQVSGYGTDLSFWLAADSLKGAAAHAVELIELLIKDFSG